MGITAAFDGYECKETRRLTTAYQRELASFELMSVMRDWFNLINAEKGLYSGIATTKNDDCPEK